MFYATSKEMDSHKKFKKFFNGTRHDQKISIFLVKVRIYKKIKDSLYQFNDAFIKILKFLEDFVENFIVKINPICRLIYIFYLNISIVYATTIFY